MTRLAKAMTRAIGTPGGPLEDRGAALVMTLLALALLTALGVSLVVLGDTDARIASSYHAGTETFYAADAAVEWTVQELSGASSGSDALSGLILSSLTDVTRQPLLASGERVDLDAITAQLQAQSNATAGLGANTPTWRLFAWGPLARMAGLDPGASRTYVASWLADDAADADGDPSVDRNGVVTMHVEAFGAAGTRRIIEATVAWLPLDGSYWPTSSEPTGTTGSPAPGVPSGTAKTVSRDFGPIGVKLLEWREVR